MITSTLIFALIMALPIKCAADFTDGRNTGILSCLIASIVAPVLAVATFRMFSGGFNGVVLAFLALLVTYIAILRVPARSTIGFSVIVIALQGATFAALISFGVNVSKLMLGQL